jgi:hypothetical protein
MEEKEFMVYTTGKLPNSDSLNQFAARGQYLMQIIIQKNEVILYFETLWQGACLVKGKFEYQIIIGAGLPNDDDMDYIMGDGWELVQIIPVGDMCYIYNRRKVLAKPEP